MKCYKCIIVVFIGLILCVANLNAQVGTNGKLLALTATVAGLPIGPTGVVTYTEINGEGVYALTIFIDDATSYTGVEIGNKISFEYADASRDVVTVQDVSETFKTNVVSRSVSSIYRTSIIVYPDFENLTSKELKRILVQCKNGNVFTMEVKPKNATKLKDGFQKAMTDALASYKQKVSNDSYFEE